ncbi:cupin [Paenibacillus sp. E194]|nr:cupin domain-containing protein [Paenibacillus sp. E194]KJB87431.1 cupin [Paenibacillus sp. E194]
MYPCNYQPWHYPSHYPQGSMNRCYSWNPYDYSWNNHQWPFSRSNMVLKDYGGQPFVVDIEQAAEQNKTYRTALWTGEHLQVTLMSIPVGGDIGLEMHPTTDQFIRIEEGQGLVRMGESKEKLDFEQHVDGNYAIMIPAGTWHNVINIGYRPLKLYSIYGPPKHPFGTVHPTKASAMAEEGSHS